MRISKQRAAEIADKLIRRGVSAYASKPTICHVMRWSSEKLSDSAADKILTAFRERAVKSDSSRYDVLSRMYCEEQLAANAISDLLEETQ